MSAIEHSNVSEGARALPAWFRPRRPLALFLGFLLLISPPLVAACVQAVDRWIWATWAVLPLITVNALWISGGATTALLGLMAPKDRATTIFAVPDSGSGPERLAEEAALSPLRPSGVRMPRMKEVTP